MKTYTVNHNNHEFKVTVASNKRFVEWVSYMNLRFVVQAEPYDSEDFPYIVRFIDMNTTLDKNKYYEITEEEPDLDFMTCEFIARIERTY